MNSSKVLILQFVTEDGKKHNVRIKGADSGITASTVQPLGEAIVKTKAFDFDGKQSPYTFNSANFVSTDKRSIVAAK